MTDPKTSDKVPFDVWASFRIQQLREEIKSIESTLNQYKSAPNQSIAETSTSALSLPVGSISTETYEYPSTSDDLPSWVLKSKFYPVVKKWEEYPNRGMTHLDIFTVASKTVKGLGSRATVRTFVSDLVRDGVVSKVDGLFFMRPERTGKAPMHS